MWSYNYTPDPDVLCHYGVKGMKWDKTKRRIGTTLKRTGREIREEYEREKAFHKTLRKHGYTKKAASAAIADAKALRASKRLVKNLSKGNYKKAAKSAGPAVKTGAKAWVKDLKRANAYGSANAAYRRTVLKQRRAKTKARRNAASQNARLTR